MDRKAFLKNSLLAGLAGAALPQTLKGKNGPKAVSSYDKLKAQIGFNHIPLPKDQKTMNTVLHKANTRGQANHGWLKVNHTFSFADYYNPERTHFGVLRVLNDDIIAPLKGFGTHPHDNMEIISIPLAGALRHKDNMGNGAVIKSGDVQVMSAGTGIKHSEFNANDNSDVNLLQIWLFPREKSVQPRYDQISIKDISKPNEFYQILSPSADDEGVWIHQDAWFHLGDFNAETASNYSIKNAGNGVYAFIIEGSATINGQDLEKRDGFGIWDAESIDILASKGSRILLMDVPMQMS